MKDDIPSRFAFGLLCTIIIIVLVLFSVAIKYLEANQRDLIKSLTLVERVENDLAFTETRLWAIAKCESGWNPDAKNPISSASGIFQFIDSTAQSTYKEMYGEDLDMSKKNDYHLQKDMAIYLARTSGLHHWVCDDLI